MANERVYAAVEVVGKAGGMNEAGWEGAIPDNEVSYLYNMHTNVDGEWTKREGCVLSKALTRGATLPVAKLHWHTDELGNYADGSSWVESGDEITSASSGALAFSGVQLYGVPVTLDGESVQFLFSGGNGCYVTFKSAFNLNATAGKLSFFFYTVPHGGGTTTADFPPNPTYTPYLFYGSSNFHIYINSSGSVIWKYGSGASEYLNLGPIVLGSWSKIEVCWDNDTVNTHWPYRFQGYINGVSIAYADPTSAVTLSFDTDVYFFNSGTSGSGGRYWYDLNSSSSYWIAFIRTWDASSAVVAVTSSVTGIHNNSSQQRAIVTVGGASSSAGLAYYSPSFTECAAHSGTYEINGVRTSAAECQGNLYITDGSTTLHYTIGSDTDIHEYTLPETAKWIEEYHGHLWIAGLGTSGAYSVRCSTIDDFVTSSAVSWPSTNQVIKCRDTVRGIKAYQGQLIVGTRSTVEAITGYQPHDFAKQILSTNANCASHWSMKEISLMGTTPALMWAGYDGIYMCVGANVTKVSWPVQDFFDSLSKTEIEEAHAVVCQKTGEYMLAVSDGSSSDNNYLIVYNYRKGDWAIWKYAYKMDVLGKYYRSGEEVILGGDSTGNIFTLNIGDTDNGSAIEGYALTKWYDGGVPDQDKDFRKLYMWCAPVANHEIQVGWSTDYKEGLVEADIVAGTDSKDYRCVISHEPSVVAGDDGNDYYCIDAHTSGYLSKPGLSVWTANTIYATNDCVTPTTPDGHVYRVTAGGGGYSGAAEPSWDTTHGNTTSDEDLTWTNDGAATSTSYWTATGTTGRGTTWATSTEYVANDDKKPITGSLYSQHWVPNNTVGQGATWSASAGYSNEKVEMEVYDKVDLDSGEDYFGNALFGTDVFGSGVTTVFKGIDLYNARGRAIRFLFRNSNANEPFKIRGLKCWYSYIPEFPA